MGNEGTEMNASTEVGDMDEKLAAVDDLSGIAEGLRGASVAVGEALESGIESNALVAFYADALRGYASRLDALAADLYGGTTHLNGAENDGNGGNGGE